MSINLDILRAINGLSGNPFWDEFFIVVAVFGDFIVRTFSVAPMLVVKPWRKIFCLWMAASCVSEFLNSKIKSLFMVKRPFLTHDWVNIIGYIPTESSFPSGHAMCAAACVAAVIPAIVKTARNKKLGIVAASLVGLIAPLMWFDRLYLGVHYPTDVLAGALIGLPLGLAIWAFSKKNVLKNPITMARSVFGKGKTGAVSNGLDSGEPLTKKRMAAALERWDAKRKGAILRASGEMAILACGVFACEMFVKRCINGSVIARWSRNVEGITGSSFLADASAYVILALVGGILLYMTLFWLLHAFASVKYLVRGSKIRRLRMMSQDGSTSADELEKAFFSVEPFMDAEPL